MNMPKHRGDRGEPLHSTYDASYLGILRELGCDVVGVSDRSERIAKDRAERFGGTPFVDYRQMIEATRPEFVIALGRHCEYAGNLPVSCRRRYAVVDGKTVGHTDPDPVAALARLAVDRGAWVTVPFVKRMIENGEFGRISHIFLRTIRPTMQRYVEWDSPWMADKSQAGGGAVLNLGPHGFDMARFITGEEPEVVSAVVSRRAH